MSAPASVPVSTPALRISPAEPRTIKDTIRDLVGDDATVRIDWSPEDRGVDFLWIDVNGYWRGVQRKEVSDFVASLNDGRLAREIAQMVAEVAMPIIVIEGNVKFAGGAVDSPMVGSYGAQTITRGSWQRRLMSIMDRGIQIMWTSTMTQTAQMVTEYWRWTQTESHTTGTTRPGPAQDWGRPSNRDWQVHLLCGLDGVGPKLANRILDQLGYCPIQVVASREDLMSVGGIGEKLAERILAVNMITAEEQLG